MNKHARSSRKATAPVQRKKMTGLGQFSLSRRDVIGLVRELRTHQKDIEHQNKELRSAMTEIIRQRHAEDVLQKSRDELERTVEDRTLELRNAYELLKSIFASIDVHLAYLDPDFNFITVNQVYAAADRRTPDFYYGKNYFDLYPEEETEAIFKDVIETGEPYYEYQKPVISSEHAVTYWDWSVLPVKDGKNNVSGLVLSMIDVTKRKRAEENTIRLAAAIESAGDSVIITDVRGIIKYVNSTFEKTTGWSKEEAVGRGKDMLDSGKQDESFYQAVRERIRRQGAWTGRVVNKKKSGTLYTEECTWSVIRNSSGEIMNYVSIGRDITDKLRLESLAQAANSDLVYDALRHKIGYQVKSICMSLGLLKSKLGRSPATELDAQIDEVLTDVLTIDHLLKT